jgi:FixJ family two-component response regulator
MNFWTAVVAIVAITAFANILMARYRYKSGGSEPVSQPQTPTRELELERELTEMRERLKVLERIATDDRQSRSIAAEIESLREK